MSPSLGRVALCSKCPVYRPSDTVFLITRAGCSKNVPYVGYVGPFFVIESWLPLSFSCMGLTIRLVDCVDQPWPQCISCCAGANHTKWNLLQVWYLLTPPYDILVVMLIGSCCDVVKSWLLTVLFPGPLGKNSGADQCQILLMTAPRQPVWSYKAIHSLWLSLLSLGVHRNDQDVHQGSFLLTLSPGEGQQKSQGTMRSVSTCWLPVASSHWKNHWRFSSCMR